MTKKKAAALVKVKTSAATCSVFCSWQAMVCPLCHVTVPANTRHTCEKTS
jgi:hypothetical protein